MQAENVTVTAETQNPGHCDSAPDFTGLSFEAALLLPKSGRRPLFSPSR